MLWRYLSLFDCGDLCYEPRLRGLKLGTLRTDEFFRLHIRVRLSRLR